jgi:hypothetical protein
LNARGAITEPSGGASGQASDIAIHAKEILRIRKLLTGIYQRHCGQSGELQEQGLHRFGTRVGVWVDDLSNLNILPSSLFRQRRHSSVIIS